MSLNLESSLLKRLTTVIIGTLFKLLNFDFKTLTASVFENKYIEGLVQN